MSIQDRAAIAQLATELETMQAETFEIADHDAEVAFADGCSTSSCTSTSSTTSSTSSG